MQQLGKEGHLFQQLSQLLSQFLVLIASMYTYISRYCIPQEILFHGKGLGGDIETIDGWFKNISLDVKIITNDSKEKKFRSFLFPCRIKC